MRNLLLGVLWDLGTVLLPPFYGKEMEGEKDLEEGEACAGSSLGKLCTWGSWGMLLRGPVLGGLMSPGSGDLPGTRMGNELLV